MHEWQWSIVHINAPLKLIQYCTDASSCQNSQGLNHVTKNSIHFFSNKIIQYLSFKNGTLQAKHISPGGLGVVRGVYLSTVYDQLSRGQDGVLPGGLAEGDTLLLPGQRGLGDAVRRAQQLGLAALHHHHLQRAAPDGGRDWRGGAMGRGGGGSWC